jgi:hypothetical protein
MQQISRAITDSIAANEKHALDLTDTQLSGKALRAKLHIQKVVVKATKLSQPKSVCSNEKCVTPVRDSSAGGTVLLRKHLCKLAHLSLLTPRIRFSRMLTFSSKAIIPVVSQTFLWEE